LYPSSQFVLSTVVGHLNPSAIVIVFELRLEPPTWAVVQPGVVIVVIVGTVVAVASSISPNFSEHEIQYCPLLTQLLQQVEVEPVI